MQNLRVLQTLEHPCGYYDDRLARNLVIDPEAAQHQEIYDLVVHGGFRRAGSTIFRPHCLTCQACQATRIESDVFKPSRSQRRNLRHNKDLRTDTCKAEFREDIFELYRQYVDSRHTGGGMANPQPDDFTSFLTSSWSNTNFLCAYYGDALVGVMAYDVLASGLSAVYSFYNCTDSRRALGVYLVLQLIKLAQETSKTFVYLGYWLADHPKMHYKLRYQPLEVFRDNQWVPKPNKKSP